MKSKIKQPEVKFGKSIWRQRAGQTVNATWHNFYTKKEDEMNVLEPLLLDLLRTKQPMLQFSSAESIGALAVFLCGPHGRTITGAAYTMDGGWVAA